MTTALPKLTATKKAVLGIALGGCAPVLVHPACQHYCVPVQEPEYCQEIPVGYVLSQDKYDPNFVPCKPRPIPPKPPVDDDNPVTPPGVDVEPEDESSSTGGGNGASAQQGNQASEALAGSGASAQSGNRASPNAENTFSGGGRGAGATSGSVNSGTNARDLL